MQFTQEEITKALDMCLNSVANEWIIKQIVNYKEFGHKTALDAARKAVGIGGGTGPGDCYHSYSRKGVELTSPCLEHRLLMPLTALVDRAYERAGVGQQTLF